MAKWSDFETHPVGTSDRIKELEELVASLEAKLEQISQEWESAVCGDLNHGVDPLNAAGATDFYRRYPLISTFGETLSRIIDGEK